MRTSIHPQPGVTAMADEIIALIEGEGIDCFGLVEVRLGKAAVEQLALGTIDTESFKKVIRNLLLIHPAIALRPRTRERVTEAVLIALPPSSLVESG